MWGADKADWMSGTKRVYNHSLKEVMNKLDDAFFALETDAEILKDADRPLVNDPKKGYGTDL